MLTTTIFRPHQPNLAFLISTHYTATYASLKAEGNLTISDIREISFPMTTIVLACILMPVLLYYESKEIPKGILPVKTTISLLFVPPGTRTGFYGPHAGFLRCSELLDFGSFRCQGPVCQEKAHQPYPGAPPIFWGSISTRLFHRVSIKDHINGNHNDT